MDATRPWRRCYVVPTVESRGPAHTHLWCKLIRYSVSISHLRFQPFRKKTIILILLAEKCSCEKLLFIRNVECFHSKIFAQKPKMTKMCIKTALWKRDFSRSLLNGMLFSFFLVIYDVLVYV